MHLDHDHDHEHCHDHQDCGTCAGCNHDPKEELIAMMKYMVKHNTSHAAELAALAEQMKTLGETTAYEQILLAVSDFEKGNMRLSTVLSAMGVK